MYKKWTEEEYSILREFYGKVKITEIEKKLPIRTRCTIQKRAQILGLKGNHHIAQKFYTIDQDLFFEPNLDNCYWAGFLAADGCLTKDSGLSITLANKDKDHLIQFKDYCGYNGKIKDYLLENKIYNKIVIWGVPNWHRDLKLYWNITKNKSLTLQPPNLDIGSDLAVNFICGYIDGDGSIWKGKNGKYKTIYFSVCGTYSMIKWIRENLKFLYPDLSWKDNINKNGHSNVNYAIRYTNKKARIIINSLYELSSKQWLMKRKWKYAIGY